MVVRRYQVIAGGTISLKLTLEDYDTGVPVTADETPQLTLTDARGQLILSGAPATPLGDGSYVYNYTTSANAIRGNWRGVFKYYLNGSPFKDDVFFGVI